MEATDPRVAVVEKDGKAVKFRLLSDWIYVRIHEPKKQKGSVILPDTVAPDLHVGTVLARGPGKDASNGSRIPVGVEPGEVVAFHRWNVEHRHGQAISQYLEEGAGLIRGDDVLVVFPPGSEPEIW